MSVVDIRDWRDAGGQAPVRELPRNFEAEQGVLGAVLTNNAAYQAVGALLEAEHFSQEVHQRIWTCIVSMVGEGKVANPITLSTFLGDHEVSPGLSMPRYLAQLAADAVTVVNAPDYARMVIDLHARRAVIAAAQEAMEQAYDAPVNLPVPRLIDGAIESLRAVSEALPQVEARETVDGALTRLRQRAQDRLNGIAEVVPHTGLDDFDRRLRGGLRRKRLVVLAGRPGMGKTILATALARRAAQRGFGVAIFNLEIDCEETGSRLVSNMMAHRSNPVPYGQIVAADLSQDQIDAVADAQDRLATFPLEVDERSGITIAQIETRAIQAGKRFARTGHRLDIVVIDYLQLVKVSDRYKGKTHEELNEIVLAAKNMAKRLDVCVVLLSQLNRGVEHRDDKHPVAADLRGSGGIEETADAIGLLYRPNFYDRKDPKFAAEDPDFIALMNQRAKDLEIDFDKNRLGPRGVDTFYCDVGLCLVDGMARHRGGN